MGVTFLTLSEGFTLKDLSDTVGSRNVSQTLSVNRIPRKRDVYTEYKKICDNTIATSPSVDWKRKVEVLNSLATDRDAFEYAAIQDPDGWKVLSNQASFRDSILIPESIEMVRYDGIIGNREPVPASVYNSVMKSLHDYGDINDQVFNDFSTIKATQINGRVAKKSSSMLFQSFSIPWGEITFYSSLSDSSVDIPAYPETISDPKSATYNTMPDVLYQYEPWYTYSNSGPRQMSFEFHLHRQMWTGDETDGKANQMIRFIEASLYPKYAGSAVYSDTVTLYVKGKPLIHGILSNTEVRWSGPIGRDGFYLEFTLTLSISEVSTRPLNYGVVKSLPLIGN